ncbi:MAG: 2-hydroxyacyl-CoA dehydratase family protein [Victivallales bacterium]
MELAVRKMEKALGLKLDPGKLSEACDLFNQAAAISKKCNDLRWSSPPLIRGAEGVYNAILFSQLWGKKDLIDIQSSSTTSCWSARSGRNSVIPSRIRHRILWLHLPPFYDTKILDYIEDTCNAPIVFEEVNFVDWIDLDPDEPYRSLARKLLTVGYLDRILGSTISARTPPRQSSTAVFSTITDSGAVRFRTVVLQNTCARSSARSICPC